MFAPPNGCSCASVNVAPMVVGRASAPSPAIIASTRCATGSIHLRWDGTPRIETWTSTYLGAEPLRFHHAIGALWLISAVARIYPARRQGRPHADPRRPAGCAQIHRAEGAGRRGMVH